MANGDRVKPRGLSQLKSDSFRIATTTGSLEHFNDYLASIDRDEERLRVAIHHLEEDNKNFEDVPSIDNWNNLNYSRTEFKRLLESGGRRIDKDSALLENALTRRRQFLVDKIIPRNEIGLLSGYGGSMKSKISGQLAFCNAIGLSNWMDGMPSLNVPEEGGKSVILTAEDRPGDYKERLEAVYFGDCADKDGAWRGIGDKFQVHYIREPLWEAGRFTPSTGSLTGFGRDFLFNFLADEKPDLLVIDNISFYHSASEIQRPVVRGFLTELGGFGNENGTTIMLIGHTSQNNEEYSGSTDWHNGVRWRLWSHKEKEENKDGEKRERLRLSIRKYNHSLPDCLEYELSGWPVLRATPWVDCRMDEDGGWKKGK